MKLMVITNENMAIAGLMRCLLSVLASNAGI